MEFRPKPYVRRAWPRAPYLQSVERDIVDNSSPSGEENMFLTPQLCIQKWVTWAKPRPL